MITWAIPIEFTIDLRLVSIFQAHKYTLILKHVFLVSVGDYKPLSYTIELVCVQIKKSDHKITTSQREKLRNGS